MQNELFGSTQTTSEDTTTIQRFDAELVDYTLVDTYSKLCKLVQHLEENRIICFDTETDSVDSMSAQIAGIAFSTGAGVAWYIPTNGGYLTTSTILDKVKPIFNDEEKVFVAHNYKYDYKVMANAGIKIKGKVFDTMVAGYLVDHTRGKKSKQLKMDTLAEEFLNYRTISIDGMLSGGKTMFDIPIEEVNIYACEDADITYQLYEYFRKKLRDEGMEKLAYDIELPVTKILAKMELEGVKLNTDFFEGFHEELQEKQDDLKAQMDDIAGYSFNPRSYLQVGEVLYDVLGLPVLEKTDSGNRATGEDVLNKLKDHHEFPELLLEYRSVKKLDGTYVEPLPKKVNLFTGRLHTSLNQTITDTGRLSSSNPNLQNIPIRSELGRKVRKGFVAEKGNLLINADYSQMELRILASICQDKNMLEIFRQGKDIHSGTASEIFDIPIEEVDHDTQRYEAKTINYAIPYGADYPKIARELEISENKAQVLLHNYFRKFPKIKTYIENMKRFVKEHGYVETRLGRRRYLPDIYANNKWKRLSAERQAVNMPIQGESADIIKMAMIKADKWLRESGLPAKMLLQVHDELIIEVKKDYADEVGKEIRDIMAKAYDIGVPLDVNYGISTTWYEGH